jgi:hypothetical protein
MLYSRFLEREWVKWLVEGLFGYCHVGKFIGGVGWTDGLGIGNGLKGEADIWRLRLGE